MKGFQIFIISLVLLVIFKTTVSKSQRKFISYQVHSFNDVREWKQLFLKNISFIKIDPNYQPHDWCIHQKRAYQDDKRGCFVLNHNNPKIKGRNDYNTSKDIIYIFSNPNEFPFLFKKRLHISLCFKFNYGEVCNTTNPYGVNFISLVSDLFKNIKNLVKIHDLDVEFIFDGSATPGGGRKCLINMWRPWNSTYIPMKDPFEAMNSNDRALGYDRFQVLDPSESQLSWLYLHFFGKWNNSFNYPVLLWEPSSQERILIEAVLFLDIAPVEVGLRFAINIDPIQFQIYSAPSEKSNGYAWNIFLDDTFKITEFKVANIEMFSTEDYGYFFLAFKENEEFNFQIFKGEKNFGEFISVANGKLKEIQVNKEKLIFLKIINNRSVLIGFSSGLIFEFSLSDDFKVKFQRKWDIGNDIEYFSIENILKNGNNLLLSSSRNNNCSLLVSFGDYEPYCVLRELEISHASTVVSGKSSEILLLFNNETKYIRGALLIINDETKKVDLEFIGNNLFDVGDNPQMSVYDDVVLEVHSDGFCFNTGNNNKRADVGVCDLIPQPIDSVLVYNYGTFESFKTILKEGNSLNVCSKGDIVHGMYDEGSFSSISLYNCPRNKNNKICMVEFHQGKSHSSSECGSANVHKGLVVDSWILPIF